MNLETGSIIPFKQWGLTASSSSSRLRSSISIGLSREQRRSIWHRYTRPSPESGGKREVPKDTYVRSVKFSTRASGSLSVSNNWFASLLALDWWDSPHDTRDAEERSTLRVSRPLFVQAWLLRPPTQLGDLCADENKTMLVSSVPCLA